MNRRLPVTLVGGFLGAGKTSLLHHFISEHQGGHLAVLVENPGSLNLDAKALRGLCGAMRREHDTILEIPNRDEAEQVEWVTTQLREFSLAGRYERVLIEVGGTTNPARLGRNFGLLPGHAQTFSPWAELQQIVCVVDALEFFQTAKRSPPDEPFREFQMTQIAGASLVVLNKCDLLRVAERDACLEVLGALPHRAPILETAYGEVPADVLTRPFDNEQSKWATESALPADSLPTKDTCLCCTLFRSHRPFHPRRFWEWFNADHPGLMRVKGIIWLATRNLLVGGVSRTRWQNACGAAGIWWAALPREEWPEDPEVLRRMQESWREPYGDRRQELVLIGDEARLPEITGHLNGCLLSADEFARPIKEWTSWPDPFPEWDVAGG